MPKLYRAEVIGSLLRPAYLKEARQQWESGQLSTRDFKRIEDHAVDDALAVQEQAGVDVVTDGEMRRTHFIAPLTDVISGVKPIPAFKRVWRRPHAPNQPAEQTEIQVQYAGSGVSADGPLNIVAKKDIVIGAGITGTAITIHAEAIQEGSGTGSIQGETISVTANTITGNLSATQGITVSGNASGANLSSSSGLVTGAGAGVASNTGSGRASAENTVASNTAEERASYTGGMGGDSGGGLSGKRVVLIDVSSSPCTDQDCS